ncbi:MAG: hypothetical protein M4579_004731 [Chaenotheca gracillima]|nr:MAG: hypothetical protein M4579_004731 [Chaenotheca gracillima]
MVDRPKKPSAIPVSPLAPAPQFDFSADNSRVTATLPTGESIEVLLYGATIISWKSASPGGKSGMKENLWLSDKAKVDGSKPVRGGIPLVFPVFGPPPSQGPISSLPQHGFARNSRWEFLNKSTSESEPTGPSSSSKNSASDSSVKLDFGLSSTNLAPEARKAWPFDFGLIYSVTLGKDGLETSMLVRNEGEKSFEFCLLMHTYLRVDDITKTTISGLQNISYVDKMANATTHTEKSAALPITAETDRVYSTPGAADSPLRVLSSGKERFSVVRDNLEDVVVWNPWEAKAAGMSDFGPQDGWKNMLCVEAGAVSRFQKLEPGDTFEGGQVIRSVL